MQTLVTTDARHDDMFGASVALHGTTLLAGAPGKRSVRGRVVSGAAYVFAEPLSAPPFTG